jgi:hypothetical protein
MASYRARVRSGIAALAIVRCLASLAVTQRTVTLGDLLFWRSVGNAAGGALSNYSDYNAHRELWTQKIAEANAKLEACGSCSDRAKIQAEYNT